MRPASVVEPFQILEDDAACHFRVWNAASMHEFGLSELAGGFQKGNSPTVIFSMG
jgi:hypothetical protein